ncbi:type II toxin-antitoxin system ParD family antitoxin [Prosthecobacter vanneervenii]|uniref:Antitoxin ParD1/3/4 n=1 Tax=Prosthecobacter vanneervenii TaxID=48466 RepID=A0A7W8DK76_9BACT|nr:type II toxin-antitoxin system ParD family antitoxin [Prosthecobacter vanneervenii]MBB5032837.1 antitoxin ParD1/3/4 [Prosthecobacter vanneervenii]
MAAGVNVRFAGELQSFIQQRVLKSGLYSSTSEYIRDLVRRDYEQEEKRKWAWLKDELRAGAEAAESEFVALDAEDLIAEARKRKKANAR